MRRTLIIFGLIILVAGLLWPFLQKIGLGRLPGDIAIKKNNIRFYFPITTCIIISIVLSIIFNLYKK